MEGLTTCRTIIESKPLRLAALGESGACPSPRMQSTTSVSSEEVLVLVSLLAGKLCSRKTTMVEHVIVNALVLDILGRTDLGFLEDCVDTFFRTSCDEVAFLVGCDCAVPLTCHNVTHIDLHSSCILSPCCVLSFSFLSFWDTISLCCPSLSPKLKRSVNLWESYERLKRCFKEAIPEYATYIRVESFALVKFGEPWSVDDFLVFEAMMCHHSHATESPMLLLSVNAWVALVRLTGSR